MNYLTNAQLLKSIWRSKLSYVDGERPIWIDHITTSLTDLPPCSIIRLDTDEHIPPCDLPRKTKHRAGITFEPFILYVTDEFSTPFEIGRSHYLNGEFSLEHGRMTARLGMQLKLLTDRYALRGNWRNYSYNDDMKSAALETLVRSALKFNDGKSNNPFGYLSQIAKNAFVRYHNAEANIRDRLDDMLEDAGQMPSMKRQIERISFPQGVAPTHE